MRRPHRQMGRPPSGGGGIPSAQPMPPRLRRLADATEPRPRPGVGPQGRRGAAPGLEGFTLVEVLSALAIAMVLAGLCTAALMQIRTMVKRSQLRIALHQRAEALHTRLDALFGSLLGSGPLVADMTAGTPRLRLLAMTSKQDNWDWDWGGSSMSLDTSDVRWQLLDWVGAEGRLYAAESSAVRSFSQYDTPLRNPAKPAIDFNVGNARFLNLPQPRRALESAPGTAAATWAEATRALDANQLFPDVSGTPSYPDTPYRSLAGANPDLGDWGDLLARRVPIADGVTDLRLEVVPVDGRAAAQRFAAGTAQFRNWPGVWLDADLAAGHGRRSGTATEALDGPIGQRPRLVRLRLILEERLRPVDPAVPDSDETRIQQVFIFSFLLPGQAGPPSGP